MSLNFSNRILTAIVLSVILFVCLYLNNFLWLYLLVVASIISFQEFNNLIKIKFKKEKNTILIYNFITIIYLINFSLIGFHLNNNNPLFLIFIILICIFSDTGGYVIGKLVGGRKLTNISPNKTISGSIGSFFFSTFPIIIFWILSNDNDFNFLTENLSKDIFILIPLSLLLSFICQLGDLFISYYKRQAKVKDTGSLLPGHGGLLDRIDGLIFVLPVAFILDKLFL